MAAAKKYVIERPYYRSGVGYFEAGSVVEIPADEKPAKSWKPYVESAPDAKPATPPAKSKRPSDGDPI